MNTPFELIGFNLYGEYAL